MPVCIMSSNGFLQILELRIIELPRLMRIGHVARRRVVRAVARPTGLWTLFTLDGEHHDARLIGSWVLARGALLGLRWHSEDGRYLHAVTSVRVQTPDVGRRLLARLRWPLPEPGDFA